MTEQPIPIIIADYMHAQRITYRGLARAMTAVLEERPLPPRSISHSAIVLWRQGIYKPEAPIFEYLRDHAKDESLREFAANMLAAMADPATVPAVKAEAAPAPTPVE